MKLSNKRLVNSWNKMEVKKRNIYHELTRRKCPVIIKDDKLVIYQKNA